MTVQDTLQAVRAHEDEFIALRRDIHQHPELPFEELRTSDLVAARLRDWGYHVERGLGGTGVVGQLKRGDGTRTLGLRADMDALPIQETTGLQYASRNQGVMHACGHDGHTAMLLAAAKVLAEQGDFSGTLNLIFQPAEEYGTSDCGAVRMINDGLFDKYPCDAVFSMHNMPGWPQGHLIFREGPMMASSDKVYITLVGHGGHGAVPHKTADPVVAAASLVMALQTVVSRNVDPLQTAVVTVGVLQSGRANNVIPDSAHLELSVRALDPEVRSLLQQRITEIVHAQAQCFGVKAEIDYRRGYAARRCCADRPTIRKTSSSAEGIRSWYLTVKSPRNGRPYLRYFSPRKQGLAGPGFEAGGVGCLPCDVLFETGCLSACESGELLLDLGDASLHCDGFEGGLVGG